MKHEKKVTEAVLAANRDNAKSSTGPRTEKGKATTSRNALRHGILARRMVLSEDEQREYHRTWQSWKEFYHPIGDEEEFLVEEITNVSWKLGITEGIETRELLRRLHVRDGIDRVFHKELQLPVSDWDLPVDRGWDCEQIVIRALADNDRSSSNTSRGPAVVQNQVVNAIQNSRNSHQQKGGHLEVQAVLGSSLETIARYRSPLKRDYYNATDKLHNLQKERKEREMKGSAKKPPPDKMLNV
jgi:hypothetical protein